MKGEEIFELCKRHVYEAWLKYRTTPAGNDLAAFVYVSGPNQIQLIVAPRTSLLRQLNSEGVDFSKNPELNGCASEPAPFPVIGIWVIIGEEDDDGQRSISVAKFIEPIFGRLGGGAIVGKA
jgi:hypothetical protein